MASLGSLAFIAAGAPPAGPWPAPVRGHCRRARHQTRPAAPRALDCVRPHRERSGRAEPAPIPEPCRFCSARPGGGIALLDLILQRGCGVTGWHASRQPAPAGRKAIAGAMFHEALQSAADDRGPAIGVLLGQVGAHCPLNGLMGLRCRQSQLSAQGGVAGGRSRLQRQSQQHHQVLGPQHGLGIGGRVSHGNASFAIRE